MGMGDEIVAAGQAQRLYDADTSARVAIFGLDGKPRWSPIWDGNPILATPADVAAGERVQRLVSGPNCRPYIVYPFSEQTGWTFDKTFRCRDHVAQIYLTEAERAYGEATRAADGPYVLVEPYTKHVNFRWPLLKWHALVAACPDLTFVQHTHADSPRIPGAIAVPATFRAACGLIAAADLYVRSESGLCHAAAALGVPQVTIFGGCMDPEVMGGYPGQTVLSDGPPCGRWLPCAHCAETMARLSVDTVMAAIRSQLRQRRQAA